MQISYKKYSGAIISSSVSASCVGVMMAEKMAMPTTAWARVPFISL